MLKLFRTSFKKTNECIGLVVIPLVAFVSILGWYFNFARFSIDELNKLIVATFTLYVMFCGFFASWLYMVKKTLEFTKKLLIFEKDRTKEFFELFMSLPRGIGRLFVPIMSATSIYLLLYIVIFFTATFFISKYVGVIDFSDFNFRFLALSGQEFLNIINGLEPNEIQVLEVWYFVMKVFVILISFITILWIPEFVYSKKNAFVALKNSIIKVFTNFGNTLFLYSYIILIITLLIKLNSIIFTFPLFAFFTLLLTYYFIVYVVVLLFTYYEQNFN